MAEIPHNTHADTTSTNDVCPECKGRGYVTYKVSSQLYKEVYGDLDIELEYKKDCPRCKGYRPEDEDRTNVPDQFREASINKFDFHCYKADMTNVEKIAKDFFKNFKKWSLNGKGLYIFSKVAGSGKTFLACCLGKSVMMSQNNGMRFKFITVPNYIDKVSEGYTLAKQGIVDSPTRIYKECELLVLDDIGTQLDKPWQNQELFTLINGRVNKGLPTIYTSNFPIDKLNIDERIKSRIYGSTIILPMPEESIRTKRANKAQDEFLKDILGGDTNGER